MELTSVCVCVCVYFSIWPKCRNVIVFIDFDIIVNLRDINSRVVEMRGRVMALFVWRSYFLSVKNRYVFCFVLKFLDGSLWSCFGYNCRCVTFLCDVCWNARRGSVQVKVEVKAVFLDFFFGYCIIAYDVYEIFLYVCSVQFQTNIVSHQSKLYNIMSHRI